jgi:hypothetical protein
MSNFILAFLPTLKLVVKVRKQKHVFLKKIDVREAFNTHVNNTHFFLLSLFTLYPLQDGIIAVIYQSNIQKYTQQFINH